MLSIRRILTVKNVFAWVGVALVVVLGGGGIIAQTPAQVLAQDAPWVHRGSPAPAGGLAKCLDQPPNQVNGIFSDTGCDLCAGPQWMADNFEVPAGGESIAQVDWWGGYFPTDIPAGGFFFDIEILDDSGAGPGAVLCASSSSATCVQTGVVLFGVSEHACSVTIDSNCDLAEGSYWIRISTDTGFGTDDWFWETGNLDPGNGGVGGAVSFDTGATWALDPNDFAISLLCKTGDGPPPVPASGTWGMIALIGLLLVGSLFFMRRRAQA